MSESLTKTLRADRALHDSTAEYHESGGLCPPEDQCETCAEYWDSQRRQGLWVDGTGWTEKAMREVAP